MKTPKPKQNKQTTRVLSPEDKAAWEALPEHEQLRILYALAKKDKAKKGHNG